MPLRAAFGARARAAVGNRRPALLFGAHSFAVYLSANQIQGFPQTNTYALSAAALGAPDAMLGFFGISSAERQRNPKSDPEGPFGVFLVSIAAP